MKNLKTMFMFAAALMAGALTSCSNEDNPNSNGDGTTKNVLIKLVQPTEESTRTVGSAVANNTRLTLSSGLLVFLSGNTVTNSFTIYKSAAVAPTGDDLSFDDLDGSKQIKVNSTANKVALVVNTSATIAVGQSWSGFLAGKLIEAQSQTAEGNVNIYGIADLSGKDGDSDGKTDVGSDGNEIYAATVILAPTEARFEVTDMKLYGFIESLNVTGVYMDGFYTKAQLDGVFTNASGVALTTTPLKDLSHNHELIDDHTDYPTTWNPALYDENAAGWGITSRVQSDGSDDGLVSAPTYGASSKSGVWGYYVFATPAYTHPATPDFTGTTTGSAVPVVLIRVDHVKCAVGTATDGSQTNAETAAEYWGTAGEKEFWITISGFNYNSKKVEHIQGGYIYATNAGALKVSEKELGKEPNITSINAEITISPLPWARVGVDPIL
ncbi:MAG: hypothetical protein LBN06_01085 [Prevotellaceae bacterium]|jgi:hypothetical protein|nr:hypothetical protein [Prevotellaceae bacterium]